MNTAQTFTTRSAAETEGLGKGLARDLRGGDILLLEAELAAGKTTFVRGLVEGLGGNPVTVSSPTFVLIQTYNCNNSSIRTVHHVDLYRLSERASDLRETGIEDALSDAFAVVAVEWPKDAIATWIPADARVWRVGIIIEKDDIRTIEVNGPGQ